MKPEIKKWGSAVVLKPYFFSLAVLTLIVGCEGYVSGDNSQGQHGNGTNVSTNVFPAPINVAEPWAILQAGVRHTCGIDVQRALWCWGDNNKGQAGLGTLGFDRFVPGRVGAETDWQRVSLGARHTCGIRAGQMWCWGSNSWGQLGQGNVPPTNEPFPLRVGTASDWTAVSVGWWHSCGIRNGEDLYCWGDNANGQLGSGSAGTGVPRFVSGGPWKSFDAGHYNTCGIRASDNALFCWGSNSDGQLGVASIGVGDNFSSNRPSSAVPGADLGWLGVSVGYDFVCGLRAGETQTDYLGTSFSTNKLFCWGRNSDNQISDSASAYFNTPQLMGAEQLGNDPTNGGILQTGTLGAYLGQGYFSNIFSAGGAHICAIEYGVKRSYLVFPHIELYKRQNRFQCYGNSDWFLGMQNLSVDATTIAISAGYNHTVKLEPITK